VLLTSAGFLSFLTVPCSVAAWVLGVRGKAKVDRGETTEQRGLAQAGLVLGIVGTVLGLMAVVGWVLLIVLAPDALDSAGAPTGLAALLRAR
jgi:hypothetical protein